VPGGNRAPLGTIREKRTLRVDEAGMAVVRRVYELAAAGRTDREVGAATAQARARGWDAAFGPSVVRVKEGQSGRGERSQPSGTDLFVPTVWQLPVRVG
jgi:hypothetical protein